jgi:hypothetical protein
MLYLGSNIPKLKLLSVRHAGQIGTVLSPIINPDNLHIDGFYCETLHSQEPLVLLDMFIRDFSPNGIIIDDHTDLGHPDELVRLQSVLKISYSLPGKKVVASGKTIGKITDYSIETKSLYIKKLYAQPYVWRNPKASTLTFDRSSIIEVTDTRITVRGPEEEQKSKLRLQMPYSMPAKTSLISE